MHECLNNNLFLVKEHVAAFKASNNYDIHDPATGDIIMLCREPKVGLFTKLLRRVGQQRWGALQPRQEMDRVGLPVQGRREGVMCIDMVLKE